MSGFARACFSALLANGVDIMLVHRSPTPEAPYDDIRLVDLPVRRLPWSDSPPSQKRLTSELQAFEPHVLYVCSWDVGAYRHAARALRGRALRVLFMDNPWRGTLKQWGGCVVSPYVIRPAFDAVFLPGERQATFATRLGFDEDRILWGANTCDHAAFDAVRRRRNGRAPAEGFLFVGRLAPEKGIDVLAAAYEDYRRTSTGPWPLLVCGTGPLDHLLRRIAGVEMLGFIQPDDLPGVFARAGCLVLPSRFEPWGVAIHEATTAGMAVVCSTACGASTRLVVDGYNGMVVPTGNAAALASGLHRAVSSLVDWEAVSRRSAELAAQFTPDRWASYFLDRVTTLLGQLNLKVTQI